MAEKKKTPTPAAAQETPAVETAPPQEAPAPQVEAAAPTTPEISEPEVRRGPGRPRKNGPAAPVSPSEAGAAVQAKGKPGRPKGAGKKTVTLDVGDLAKQVMGLHQLAALATGIPEFQLAPQEAEMLAGGISAVCEEYGLSLSGKTGAAVQLLAAAAMVYAPRVAIIGQRVKANKLAAAQQKAAEAASTVVPESHIPAAPFTVVGGTDASPTH